MIEEEAIGRFDFGALRIAIEGRDPCLVDLAVAPQWDALRKDPRFQRMAKSAPARKRNTSNRGSRRRMKSSTWTIPPTA